MKPGGESAAGAEVACADELDIAGKRGGSFGTGQDHVFALKWIAQALFGVPGPFHELIGDEQTSVSEREFARTESLFSKTAEQLGRLDLGVDLANGREEKAGGLAFGAGFVVQDPRPELLGRGWWEKCPKPAQGV